ncbi:hypothetical protein [Anaerococcus kampingiae]
MKNGNFSARQEINCIAEILDKNYAMYGSITDLFDRNFIKFSKKGPFTSLKQMRDFLARQTSNQEELLILNCEMLLYLIHEYKYSICNSNRFLRESNLTTPEKGLKYLERHIYEVVDRIHHKVVKVDDDYNFIIVPKDKKSIQAAEIVACNDENIAIKILEYKHFSNTVDDKEKILISIAKYMENKRADLSNKLNEDGLYMQKNGKNVLVEQMFEMFNNLHIRHNTDKQYIKKSEREKWYDYTYNTILTVIIIEEQSKINREFKELKDDNRKK